MTSPSRSNRASTLASASSPLAQLSDCELEMFDYMGRGLWTREIAEKLTLSPETIDSYRVRVR